MFRLNVKPFFQASSLQSADCVRITPKQHRGRGEIVPLIKKNVRSVPKSGGLTLTLSKARGRQYLSFQVPGGYLRLWYQYHTTLVSSPSLSVGFQTWIKHLFKSIKVWDFVQQSGSTQDLIRQKRVPYTYSIFYCTFRWTRHCTFLRLSGVLRCPVVLGWVLVFQLVYAFYAGSLRVYCGFPGMSSALKRWTFPFDIWCFSECARCLSFAQWA